MDTKISKNSYETVNKRLKDEKFIFNDKNKDFILGYLTCLNDLKIKFHGRLNDLIQIDPDNVSKEN